LHSQGDTESNVEDCTIVTTTEGSNDSRSDER